LRLLLLSFSEFHIPKQALSVDCQKANFLRNWCIFFTVMHESLLILPALVVSS
jgi:hypothetical protein